ncbi:MAG: hypothetical protein A2V67_00840 [Deltaproteobacteria bacterium RBG_13_61_14]|nr:MAG: hypothetical protein A2V67_00840 [Deltaproteobacteria bacterium RBG_13_61_14]
MKKTKLNRETKKKILEARELIEVVKKTDGNEAETRSRIERIFEMLLGYDVFKHISRETAVRAYGGTDEHCDFAIRLGDGKRAKPDVILEIKAVNVDLAEKHLKQVTHYAIESGCAWVLLTNGREWQLHLVSGDPPQTTLVENWDLLKDSLEDLGRKFQLISYKNLKKKGLDKLSKSMKALTPHNLLATLISEKLIKALRRELRKSSGVQVSPPELLKAIECLLNAEALEEMDTIKFSLPKRKAKRIVREPSSLDTSMKSEVGVKVPPSGTPQSGVKP